MHRPTALATLWLSLPLLAHAQGLPGMTLKTATVTLTLKSGDTDAINAAGRELAAAGATVSLEIKMTQATDAAGRTVESAPMTTLKATHSASTQAQAALPALDCAAYAGRRGIASCALHTDLNYAKP